MTGFRKRNKRSNGRIQRLQIVEHLFTNSSNWREKQTNDKQIKNKQIVVSLYDSGKIHGKPRFVSLAKSILNLCWAITMLM